MSISETFSIDKEGRVERFPLFRKFFITLIIILVTGLAFGIGRLSGTGEREPIRVEYDPALGGTDQTSSVINALPNTQNPSRQESVVVSKNSDKYHFLYCGGANQIKEENKIYFTSAEEAESLGYTLAGNCKTR